MSKIKFFVFFMLLNLCFATAFSQVILLAGAPGSGKGTQSAVIQSYFLQKGKKIPAYSVGELLRQAKELGKLSEQDKRLMDEGGLLPAENVINIVKDTLDCRAGCILDGYPRNIESIKPLEKLLNKQGIKIDLILFFKINKAVALSRILGRGEGRADDNERSFLRRWEEFQNKTIPTLETLQKQYPQNFVEINAEKSKEEVTNMVKKTLKNL
jgi:adenylate kinase